MLVSTLGQIHSNQLMSHYFVNCEQHCKLQVQKAEHQMPSIFLKKGASDAFVLLTLVERNLFEVDCSVGFMTTFGLSLFNTTLQAWNSIFFSQYFSVSISIS